MILTGELEPYSRFGYAMASLGDTNGDGLDGIVMPLTFDTLWLMVACSFKPWGFWGQALLYLLMRFL